MKKVFAYSLCVGILVFSVIMLTKIVPYLGFDHAINFLGTKPDEVLNTLHFRIGFYVHILSSLWVMVLGLLQFIPVFFKKDPKFHRNIGKIYIAVILCLAAPSGLVLSFYANGGLPAKVGFVLQSILWWFFTFWAYRAILDKKLQLHTEMMFRSYALTLAAMSLRLESYIMYYVFETKPIETYLTVTWLSWVGNLLLIQWFIETGGAKRHLQRFYKKA